MSDPADVRDLTDEEMIEVYQRLKSQGSGGDSRLTPPDTGPFDAVEEEIERRRLGPDREDLIPPSDIDGGGQTRVRDQA
jgi:hypothetical protein